MRARLYAGKIRSRQQEDTALNIIAIFLPGLHRPRTDSDPVDSARVITRRRDSHPTERLEGSRMLTLPQHPAGLVIGRTVKAYMPDRCALRSTDATAGPAKEG